jgi:hypothetical protein
LAQLLHFDDGIDVFTKITVKIEMRGRPANEIGPELQAELSAILGKELVPCFELGTFAIDNQSVEIEDQRLNHVASA